MRKNCFAENLGATVYENLDQYPPPFFHSFPF